MSIPASITTPTACGCCGESCSLECRSKAAIAELCGHAEFTDPSTPPRLYRRKTVSSAEPFTVCTDLPASCAEDPTIGDLEWEVSGASGSQSNGGTPPKDQNDFSNGNWRLVYVSTSGTTDTYQLVTAEATFGSWADDHCPPGTPPPNRPCYLQAGRVGTLRIRNPADTATFANLAIGNTVTFAASEQGLTYPMWGEFPGWSGPAVVSSFVPRKGPMGEGYIDTWDIVDQYDAEDCTTSQVDNSTREATATSNRGDVCGRPLDGSPTTIACAVTACYGDGLVEDSVDPTVRVYAGAGCVETAGVWETFSGEITETLDDEDTEEDAIARAVVGETWTEGDCDTHTSWSTPRGDEDTTFGFQTAEVRAVVGTVEEPLTIGNTYRVTITLGTRTLGGGGVFTISDTIQVEFLADATIETTDWIEIPIESGIETKAIGCLYIDITP